MPELIFESHSTSCDNEKGVASGILDCPLSRLGKDQAEELGKRHRESGAEVVYCSDLCRSFGTAEIAFQGRAVPIVKDRRLREWDYGEYNGQPAAIVERLKPNYIKTPFPGGESLQEAVDRIGNFFEEIAGRFSCKTHLFIGHRAGYYACEHYFNQAPLEEIVKRAWKWQPGWRYALDLKMFRAR